MDDKTVEQEEWRPIESWPYEVSNFGRIRRSRGGRAATAGRIKQPSIGSVGYYEVCLSNKSFCRTFRVHRLVCETFHGPAPAAGMQVAHADGTRTNNRIDNLRWATRSENMQDSIRHGTFVHGVNHPNSKLSDNIVRAIFSDSLPYEKIGIKFGVSLGVVSEIKRGVAWRHLGLCP